MFQVKVFWVVMPCSVMLGYRCFRGPSMLLPSSGQPEDGGSMGLWISVSYYNN